MHIQDRQIHGSAPSYHLVVAMTGVCAVAAASVLSLSGIDPETKWQGAWLSVAAFLTVYLGLHRREASRQAAQPAVVNDGPAYDSIEKFDEFAESFAGSIRKADVFRLIASRIRSIIPAGPMALYLQDRARGQLQLEETDGTDAMFAPERDNAEKCFAASAVCVSDNGVVALPLINAGEAFGALELHFKHDELPNEGSRWIFDAIATRVSPMILNSIAFERSVSSALIDVTTELPNERALYLILENQIAESLRKRGERPLTVLAIDICGFDEVNRKFGHAAGDRALTFVAEVVRDNLRQMDFLVRCNDDEFLAVLPTASKEISQEIVQRITTPLFGRTLPVADGHSIGAELNFGTSVFGDDGETAEQLIAAARLRKDQKKSTRSRNVLWFPQEPAR